MGRALLLAGGTALGADQVYPMEQLLLQHGIGAYDVVAGVSVGSVNGCMFAANKMERLRSIWEQVDGLTFFLEPDLLGPPGITSLNPLRRKLKRNVSQAEILPTIRFTSGVTDFQTDTYLDLPSTGFEDNDAFLDSIVASASQPVLMRGYRVQTAGASSDKHWCFDGGVKHVVPSLIDPNAFDHIDVILCNPPLRLKKLGEEQLDNIIEVGMRAFDIMANQNTLISDVERLKEWGEDGAQVTIYAPHEHDDEFDASHTAVMRRLNEVGPWMWENPWTAEQFLEHWKNS